MKFKRFLALALSLLMVFGGAASIFADDAEPAAEEVTAASPYQAAIDSLKALGIFKGDDNGDSADKAITRWQMSLFVSRSLTGETDDAYWGKTAYDYSKFTDVTGTSSLYLGAIGYANQKGIILGYDDPVTGKAIFNPDGGITYQDALTMATRTLGFTGLSYPWGNIEKAIDLGLTKGLVDVGYQDELNRGEVAQIVYNMLVAKVLGADGKYWTLKDKAFGIEEAVVVIVAGDQVRYNLDNDTLLRDNYVSFQILGENGKVTEPVYSISATAFGIDKDEDPDAYVGYSYSVATADEFASFVSCEMNPTETYWNLGKTTKGTEFTATKFNEGKTNEYTKLVIVNPDDAKDTTDNYSIVEKYTTLRTVQGSKTGVELIPGDSELLVYDPSVKSTIVKAEGSGYYTDAAGNILTISSDVWDSTLGKYVTKLTIKYYYNRFTNSYYKRNDTSTYYDETYLIGYIPVTAEELAKVKVGYEETSKWSFGQKTALSDLSSTYAYSSLTLIDDYRAYEGYDRAIYKAYGLGKIVTSEKDGDGVLRTRIYTPNGKVTKTDLPVDVKASTNVKFVDAVTGKAIDTPKDGAWVLYKYNGMTNTVEVLETLTVEKGTLTGWNIAGKTVTIGNEKFPANYDTLLNNGFKYGTINDVDYNTINNQTLYGLYTRGINYIVIDGEVVWVEANAVDTSGVVVLHSFLGVTSDGMLEYYAYTTKNPGSLQKIKVGSINNWYFGYYTNSGNYNALYSNAYANLVGTGSVKGQIYRIAAIADTGVYYLTDAESSTRTLTFDTYYRAVFTDGAFQKNGMSDPVTAISIASDTFYVFVRVDAAGNVIDLVTAKGNPGSLDSIKGNYYWASSKMIVAVVSDADSWTYITTAFNSTANIAYYYAPTGTTNYPVGETGSDATGSAVITYARLINLVTGKEETVVTTNIKVSVGGTYKAEDGVIVAKLAHTTASPVWTQVKNAYRDVITSNANTQYIYGGEVTIVGTPNGTDDDVFKAFRALLLTRIDDSIAANANVNTVKHSATTNVVVQNAKNVIFRNLDGKSDADIVVGTKTDGPAIKAAVSDITKKSTYTIEYFYSTTGAVVAYITGTSVYTAPAPSTIVDMEYYVNEGAPSFFTAKITANATSITATYQEEIAKFVPANVEFDDDYYYNPYDFRLERYELINNVWGWRPVNIPAVYNNSILTSSNDGKTVTITFNNGNGAIALDAGTYRVSGFAIYTYNTVTNDWYCHAMADGEYVEFVVPVTAP